MSTVVEMGRGSLEVELMRFADGVHIRVVKERE